MTQPEPHSWQFFLSTREAWEAMYHDCEQATRSIELEQYIFENDALGQKFLDLFIKKAAEGVKIFVVCDRHGSSNLIGSPAIEKLHAQGGRFYFYHALGLWNLLWPRWWFPRTHIKTLLVDSTIAYTGGVCLAERMRPWRDTQIRITGPVVSQIRKAFDDIEHALLNQKPLKFTKKARYHEEFAYLESYPILSWHIIYRTLMKAMGRAKHSICVSTAFFAPNHRFRRALIKACERGVDVTLLVPERSDVRVADWLYLSYAKQLIKAGIKIFRYKNSMLHNKTVVIDDQWATIGSTNMDILSFFLNRESNLIITNPKAVAELKQHFLADLQQSKELTLEELNNRPLWEKPIGYLARLVKSFLWQE
jgi:cardiolipin synthase